jgi:hypothetical protein
MYPRFRILTFAAILGAACSDSNGPADPISGTWNGKFDNGIQITAPLTLSSGTIAGTYGAGSDSGTVSGSFGSSFSIQLTATVGTQRTLSNQQLVNNSQRITAHWDDGSSQSGELCLAKTGSPACP